MSLELRQHWEILLVDLAPVLPSRIATIQLVARGLPKPELAAQEAQEGIERSADLGALARVPLLLILLGILHDLDGRFPDRRSAIYHRVTDLLLDRWERARARARGSTLLSDPGPRRYAACGLHPRLVAHGAGAIRSLR